MPYRYSRRKRSTRRTRRYRNGGRIRSRVTYDPDFGSTTLYRFRTKRPTVYSFKQVVDRGNITASVSGTYGTLAFNLNDLPQAATFTSLFDQYMITKIVVKFVPQINQIVFQENVPSQVIPSDNKPIPYLYTVVDYDDDTNLSSINAALEYDNVKYCQATRPHKRILVPHVASAGYAGTFTGFLNEKRKWIDAASTTVRHYGVKYILSNSSANLGTMDMYKMLVTYYFKFRAVR